VIFLLRRRRLTAADASATNLSADDDFMTVDGAGVLG
jgi:hypothetical protein